jgi:hypothetical protein
VTCGGVRDLPIGQVACDLLALQLGHGANYANPFVALPRLDHSPVQGSLTKQAKNVGIKEGIPVVGSVVSSTEISIKGT